MGQLIEKSLQGSSPGVKRSGEAPSLNSLFTGKTNQFSSGEGQEEGSRGKGLEVSRK